MPYDDEDKFSKEASEGVCGKIHHYGYINFKSFTFREETICVNNVNELYLSKPIKTSHSQKLSIFITNVGCSLLTAHLLVCPEPDCYIYGSETIPVRPEETIILVPYYFGKYTKVCLKSCNNMCAKIYVQSQDFH